MIGRDNLYSSPLKESINSINSLFKGKTSKKNKRLLNNKRKREFKSVSNIIKRRIIDEENSTTNKAVPNSFKFQEFSKNALSLIFAYLDIDDILKLKNIGCRNVRNFINEIFQEKRNNGYLNLKLISSKKPTNIVLDSDTLPCKRYFYKNALINYDIENEPWIKYIVFHKSSNKIYYLVKTLFFYYFCSCDINKKINKENWENDILFKIKEFRFYNNFQFIDESKVVFFSLCNILLYDLSNRDYKYNIFNLDFISDFVLYKSNLHLLIVPHTSCDYISFYSLNKYLPKNVKKEKNKIEVKHKKDCENGQIKDLCGNLICYFCSCSNHVKIFDCKKMKIANNIELDSGIQNIESNQKYLIVYNIGDWMNFFDINTFEFKFKFNFAKNDIRYISMVEPSSLDNIFLVIKSNKKMCLMYLEDLSYFSVLHLENEFNSEIVNNYFINNSLSKEKKDDNEIIFKLNTRMMCCNDNYSSDKYFINDYSMDI